MIHTLETLTVGKYGKIERTKRIRLLRKWWNPIPVSFFNTDKLINEISNNLDSGMDRRLAKEKARLITWNKILILESLKTAIHVLIVTKPANDQWNITKKNSRKLSKDLAGYIAQVEELTGIKIKDLDSIRVLIQEIQRRKIKFQERYNLKNDNPNEEISFTKYAYSVFIILEMAYNPDTTMAEFFELLKLATKRSKDIEKMKRKNEK